MPHVAIELFVGLLGLCVGSFLNVVIYRLSAGLSIANPPRSFCPRCGLDRLAGQSAVLSWLLLRGAVPGCARRSRCNIRSWRP